MARIIRIKAQPHAIGGRFCRGGRCFGTVCTTLGEDELTAEQLAAFQAEPMLVVEITEEVKPTAPQAKAEANAKEGAKEEAKPAAAPQEGETAKATAAPAAVAKAAEAKAEAKATEAAKPAAKPATKEGGK